MAGNSFHGLATQFSASASRLKANINSVIEKYDRHFEDDDLISLASLSVSKLSSRGTLKKIKDSHEFGTSNLKTTKKKDELLKLKLGWKGNAVDLNVSRAIERECVYALTNVDKTAANEPSDAETLSSFDDCFDQGDGDEKFDSWDEEENYEDEISRDTSDDERLVGGSDVQGHKDSSAGDESDSIEISRYSSGPLVEESDLGNNNRREVNNATVVILSDESADDCGDEVYGTAADHDISKTKVIEDHQFKSLNCTYVLQSSNEDTACKKGTQSGIGEVTESSFVSISSPRPKVRNAVRNSRTQSNGRSLPLLPIITDISKSKTNFNKPPQIPNYSGTIQKTVIGQEKQLLTENVIKYDGLFKNPQGIKIRRIAPIAVGPTSNSQGPIRFSPKHSSNSSGFSSSSSLCRWDSNVNSKGESVQPSMNIHQGIAVRSDIKKPVAENPYHRMNYQNVEDSSIHAKANRVDQWVNMVNMNSTAVEEPLHYPSCPPKLPNHFCQKTVQDRSPTVQKLSTSPSPSLNKQRDIGIQTTLDCTGRCVKRSSPSRGTMKDVGTLLSNSFLDAHSPRGNASPQFKEADIGNVLNTSLDQNTMFPEEYIYRFSPLNPNRIDSDKSANLHQNQYLQQDLKCFRPRRNEKRALEEENYFDLSCPPRNSKFMKLNNAVEDLSHNLRSQRCSLASPNSFSLKNGNGTFVVNSSTSGKRIIDCNYKSCMKGKTDHRDYRNPIPRNTEYVSRAGDTSNNLQRYLSKQNDLRASTPLCSDDCLDDSCEYISSTFSEIGLANDSHDNEFLASPKLSVFMNSPENLKSSDYLQSKTGETNDDLCDSLYRKTNSKIPPSFLSPVKFKDSRFPCPKNTGLQNRFQFSSANIDSFIDKDVNDSFNASLPSKDHGCGDLAEHRQVRNVLNVHPIAKASDKIKHPIPCFSLHEYYMEEDQDEAFSGSFVDAHTPKAKVLQSSPQKPFISDKYKLTGKDTDKVPLQQQVKPAQTKVCKYTLPTKTLPCALEKVPFNAENSFNEPFVEHCSNSSPNRKYCFPSKRPREHWRRESSHCVSKVRHHKTYHHKENKNMSMAKEINRSNTEDGNLNWSSRINMGCSHDLSNIPFSSSVATLNNTMSTIHGSDEEEVEEECDLEDFVDNVSLNSNKQIQSKGYSSMNKCLSYVSPKRTHSDQSHLNQYFIEKVKPVFSDSNRRLGYSSHNLHYRASTPVRPHRIVPSISMNSSISTIVSHQDKQLESDSSDEDWETKIIEDVDIV